MLIISTLITSVDEYLRHSKCGTTAIMLLLQTDRTDPTQLASRLAQQKSEKPYAYPQLASSNSK